MSPLSSSRRDAPPIAFCPTSGSVDKSACVPAGKKTHPTILLASRSVYRRADACPALPPVASAGRQQTICQFATDILATDLVLEDDVVARLVQSCRTLLKKDPVSTDEKAITSLLGWVQLDLFTSYPDVVRLLMDHRQALPVPLPSLTALARNCYRANVWNLLQPLFDELPQWQQREFLNRGLVQERSLSQTEELAVWYKQACAKLAIPLETASLWERCINPETTDFILSPCFALISREEQLAAATETIKNIASAALSVIERGETVLPSAQKNSLANEYEELRVITVLNRLAEENDRIPEWLLSQDAACQSVILFLCVRYYSPVPSGELAQTLDRAMQQGMLPDHRILKLSDASGQFFSHYFFKTGAYAVLDALRQYINLKQGSVAGDGSGPAVGSHPLSSLHLYPLRLPGGRNPLFDQGTLVPDFSRDLRQMHALVGEEGLLELMLEAENRGSLAWWVWQLRCLQRHPALHGRLLEDPRSHQIHLKLSEHAGVPLPTVLERFWKPLAPLDRASLQQLLLQKIIGHATEISGDDEDLIQRAWPLLDASLVLCQPQPCRWLLQNILTDDKPCWNRLHASFFDGWSNNFYKMQNLLIASWCCTNPPALARHFDAYLAEQLASPLNQSACRAPGRCLTENRYPALFTPTAAGTYGRTVWFRTETDVIRLKLHKKGEPLADLLREQWTLEFVGDARQLQLKGQRPTPLGSGWLPDFAGWLERSGLDAATQQTLRASVEQAEDGAVWGVVLQTADEGYHEYAHVPDALGCSDAALAGIELAARDAGVLLRQGLAPTNLLPLYHTVPWGATSRGDCRAWQFAYDKVLGAIRDWDGASTDHGNVARAPYGLRDWADIRTFEAMASEAMASEAMASDAVMPCREQCWQSGTLKVNEAGKLLTGLSLLLARLYSADFDCYNQQRVDINRARVSSQLLRIFRAFMEEFTDNCQAVMVWQHSVEQQGLFEAAARQIVFWCETGETPSFEKHLRDGTLPEDIPRDYAGVWPQKKPLRFSLFRKNTLRDHKNQYPLVQLSALIYLTLGHAIAATDSLNQSAAGSGRS